MAVKSMHFFGERSPALEQLPKLFPHFHFSTLQQTHSDVVVESTEAGPGPQADAHWTKKENLALVIRTADCLPILIHAPQVVAAVHAGWRGVANGILQKTLSVVQKEQGGLQDVRVYVGPHIRVTSFEVGLEVAEQLWSIYQQAGGRFREKIWQPHKNSEKAFIDLSEITRQQCTYAGVTVANIHMDIRDTYSEPFLHSYRRDGSSAGRQVSFIALRSSI